MNITTFKAPPDGFDPVTAPLKTLALHGIPRRPDPQSEPGLRALWDKAFARKPKFIVPEANPALVWKSAPHRVPKQKEFGLAGDWQEPLFPVASLGFTPPEPAKVRAGGQSRASPDHSAGPETKVGWRAIGREPLFRSRLSALRHPNLPTWSTPNGSSPRSAQRHPNRALTALASGSAWAVMERITCFRRAPPQRSPARALATGRGPNGFPQRHPNRALTALASGSGLGGYGT